MKEPLELASVDVQFHSVVVVVVVAADHSAVDGSVAVVAIDSPSLAVVV